MRARCPLTLLQFIGDAWVTNLSELRKLTDALARDRLTVVEEFRAAKHVCARVSVCVCVCVLL
jgi:hypothetical protein